MQIAYSLILEIRYFALATLVEVCTAFIIRFLTCADSDAVGAVTCCDGDDGAEDEDEPKGLKPPKDIFFGGRSTDGGRSREQ